MFVDTLYIQVDKAYGDVEDEFVWAQGWYGLAYTNSSWYIYCELVTLYIVNLFISVFILG